MTTRFEYVLLYFLRYSTMIEYDDTFSTFFVDKYYDYEYDYKEHRGRDNLKEILNAN